MGNSSLPPPTPVNNVFGEPQVDDDPRCLLEAFNDLANVVMSTNHCQTVLEAKVSKSLSQQRLLLENQKEILKAIKANGVGQARSTQFQPSTETQLPPLNYNTILEQHGKRNGLDPMQLYSTWFIDRMKESYEVLEKKTTSNRSSIARYKMAMAILLKLSGKYPPIKPSAVTL
jgi:hypothetical protein